MQHVPKDAEQTKAEWKAIGIVGIVAAVLFASWMIGSINSDPVEEEVISKADLERKNCKADYAYYGSTRFVKDALKAPGSAVFPAVSEAGVSVLETGICVFTIVGFVDAQNTFGAMIRSNYVLVVENPGASGPFNWNPIELTFE